MARRKPRPTVPSGPTTAESIAAGRVPDGWIPKRWFERLMYLAERCERDYADRANELRQWAAAVEAKHERIK